MTLCFRVTTNPLTLGQQKCAIMELYAALTTLAFNYNMLNDELLE